MIWHLILLIIIWRFYFTFHAIGLRLFRWGSDGLLKFEISWDGAQDEYRTSPEYPTSTYGLFSHSGWCLIGLKLRGWGVGLVLFNIFVGFWNDEEHYYYNERSAWLPQWRQK